MSSRSLIVLPDDAATPILEAIGNAKKALRIKMFVFSDPALIDAVIAAPAGNFSFLAPDDTANWRVTVRAHNGAGWVAWSAAVTVPALN